VKDFFSTQSEAYKKYRPVYPQALYDYIVSFVETKNKALDVATGNGQAAIALAGYFNQVTGIDISSTQLAQAEKKHNIEYHHSAAEQTFFKPHTFDLITVAQAYHWLQHEAFATEAARIARPGSVMAVWGYDRFQTGNKALNHVMDVFYNDIVGPYWDDARKSVDNHYQDLPFPYDPLPTRSFAIEASWRKEQLLGYLWSWSAVQQYIQVHGTSPILLIQDEVTALLGNAAIHVKFPLFLLLGRIKPQ
jgi:ubiquinone/menaquinone biosynthesis C-methylase UbiE